MVAPLDIALQVDAFFSEPVLPLGLGTMESFRASVMSAQTVTTQHTRFHLEGDVGAETRLRLVGFADFAGNAGVLVCYESACCSHCRRQFQKNGIREVHAQESCTSRSVHTSTGVCSWDMGKQRKQTQAALGKMC